VAKKLPRATHVGTLKLGDIEFPCMVLDDGTRIISGTGFMKAMGMYRSGALSTRRKDTPDGAQIPLFLAYKNLKPFINNELIDVLNASLEYLPIKGSRPQKGGIKAEAIPQICDVWLKARDEGVLGATQQTIAKKADIVMRALAHVGIIALVDEATGYQYHRARKALEEILDKFISKELLKWAKTFPDEFYEEMFRLRGWQYVPFSIKRPGVVGKYTNDLVYERLAPGVLEELKRITPRDEKGRTKHRYFQRLTEDVGNPRLREHLSAVIALMRASTKWDQFYRMVQRALPKYGEQMPLDLEEKDDNQ
jgi:hypothetical protein